MLQLDQTALLLDGLRPPPGMGIDVAVGTTFTLDLAALLSIPVAATFASNIEEDPADLLETIRRYADRTVLFCQAGAISVPPKYRAALTFVEQTVVEVQKPSSGIFHPKMWAVRFKGPAGVTHRVLVMSRNLTFDRSWDVIVRLDEADAGDTTMATGGVVDLLRYLPEKTARSLSKPQADLLEDLSGSLAQVELAVPEPFTRGTLRPFLSRNDGQPFRFSCDHALAISPFLTTSAAKQFIKGTKYWAGVISRPAAIDASADGLRTAERVLRLKDAVLDAERTIDDTFDVDDDPESATDPTRDLRGLHAKTYVQDHGQSATAWIGSANLTTGAFSTNVELLVELTGPLAEVGVDALFSPTPEKKNLSWFVEDHPLPDEGLEIEDLDEISELDGHSFDLASRDIVVALEGNGDEWDAHLSIEPWTPPPEAVVRARLLTLSDDSLVAVTEGRATWSAIPQTQITPFVVFELKIGPSVRRTLVRARLEGDPEDRRKSVIADAIASRDDFFRYLAALLGADLGVGAGSGSGMFTGGWTGSGVVVRVLEDLLTTASREPARLASLDETLKQLQRRPDVASIVPDEFHALWDAVYTACKGTIR